LLGGDRKNMEYKITPLDEQETTMRVDYYERKITVYTNRKSVAIRLKKKLGEPTKIYEYDGKINGVEYTRNLFDKDAARFFSKMLIIGTYRKHESNEED
jgi:hypothetical protein